jgi:hypothetical protein
MSASSGGEPAMLSHDEIVREWSNKPLSLIVARSVMKLAEDRVAETPQIVVDFETQGLLRRFPDGSLYLTTWDASESFYKQVLQRSGGFAQSTYRSLAAFAPARFLLAYPYKLFDQAEVVGFGVGNSYAVRPAPSEFNLQSLALSICFKRRANDEVRKGYAALVLDWFASVRERGIFGEGPMAHLSSELSFQGLVAQFRVDASLSGQHTLNWFILKALEFAMEVSTLTRITIAEEEYLDKITLGGRVGKVISLALDPNDRRNDDLGQQEPDVEDPVGHVLSNERILPKDCVPLKEPVGKLSLFKRPRDEWDNWKVEVHFTVSPGSAQRKIFREIINAWKTVGEFGAFGADISIILRDCTLMRKKDLHFSRLIWVVRTQKLHFLYCSDYWKASMTPCSQLRQSSLVEARRAEGKCNATN